MNKVIELLYLLPWVVVEKGDNPKQQLNLIEIKV